jgi:hypothetical protein
LVQQIQPQSVALTGTIQPLVIIEPGQPPATIIDRGAPFTIQVQVSLNGSLVPHLAGDHFVTQARIESLGGGYEGNIGPNVITIVNPVGLTWNAVISIHCPPAGSFQPPGSPGYIQEGVYDLAVLMRLYNSANVPLGITGYATIEFIEFYNSPTSPA